MSEIELLYKNAGVEKRAYYNGCPKGQYLSNNLTCYECEYFSTETPYLKCSYRVYPPFTAEKQLELIKWLAYKMHITIGKGLPWGQYDDDWWTITGKKGYASTNAYELEEALADFVNCLWQDLTESEQEQIRSILNE